MELEDERRPRRVKDGGHVRHRAAEEGGPGGVLVDLLVLQVEEELEVVAPDAAETAEGVGAKQFFGYSADGNGSEGHVRASVLMHVIRRESSYLGILPSIKRNLIFPLHAGYVIALRA